MHQDTALLLVRTTSLGTVWN